jgi:hypothetical protein
MSCDFMPILISEALFAYWTSMMASKPNLKARYAKQMPTLCQRANIESVLTYDT